MLLRAFRPIRRVVAAGRSDARDRHLALSLTFIAGAANAGGILAIGQYTSHMTGIVSAMADHLALGSLPLVGAGAAALAAFMAGAAVSAGLINWARLHRAHAQYALPLLLEAALMAILGVLGSVLAADAGFMAAAVPLLCFIMGLQNATITKVSGARMRTTHMTGIVTDIGIELGKLAYWNRARALPGPKVHADRAKLRLLASLLGMFVAGGVLGAWGFTALGFAAVLPLAAALAIMGGGRAAEAAVVQARRRAVRLRRGPQATTPRARQPAPGDSGPKTR